MTAHKKINPEEVLRLRGEKRGIREIARLFHVSPSTVHECIARATRTPNPNTQPEHPTRTPPSVSSEASIGQNNTISIVDLARFLSAHKLVYCIEYSGRQPRLGADKAVKLNHWNSTVFFLPDMEKRAFTITTSVKTLRIFVRNSFGNTPSEILTDAERRAKRQLEWFAQKHGLVLKWETFRKERSCDWIVENAKLGEEFKPLAELKVRTPASEFSLNYSSHPGKLELRDRQDEARDKKRIAALETDHMARGLEFVFLEMPVMLPKALAALACAQTKQTEILEALSRGQLQQTEILLALAEALNAPMNKKPSWVELS